MGNFFGGLFVVGYFGFTLFVLVFLLTMIYRLVNAQESSSRHLLEIARDIKALLKERE